MTRMVLLVASVAWLTCSCGSSSHSNQNQPDVPERGDTDGTDLTAPNDVQGSDLPALSDADDFDVPDQGDVQGPDLPTPADADAADLPAPSDVEVPDLPDTITEAVAWGPCPDYISDSGNFQCAMVELPLDHGNPDGEKIGVFVYRLAAKKQNGKRQIWFLQGGPGGSGADFAPIFAIYAKAHPEWELLSLDHRGVGNSARLTCPQESSQFGFDYEGCVTALQAQWADGLMQFTTTQAANDLAALIELVRQPDVPVFVYGGSYGTYWGLRHVRLFPAQIDGAILDSICSPGHCHLDDYDANFNANGQLLMAACAEDPTCGTKLGAIDSDPWKVVADMFAKADAGTLCDGQFPMLERPLIRQFLGMAEMDRMLRALIPALVYRLHRCDANDKEVLMYFFNAIQQMMGGGMSLFDYLEKYEDLEASATLGTHIINSELVGSRTLAEVQAIVDEAFFSTDASPFMKEVEQSGKWPKYPDDGHMNQFGATSTPILMMNGSLDPQTTMAMAIPSGEYYTGANQTFVEIPYAPHGVIASSLTNAAEMDYLSGSGDYLMKTCGFMMMEGFVIDPSQPIDTTCLQDLSPLDFGIENYMNMALAMYLMNTNDMYDGIAGDTAFAAPLPPMVQPVAPLRRPK